ncbi:MAG: Asp-tRNA(Asn)/Glu-tRNA(Gln) amidotransferase subunit GatB [bacterium]
MMDYEAVIGLEVHAHLLTQSKIFCGCSTRFGSSPNTQTCPICQGMPGVLPVLNRQAVELALRAALAMNCQIASFCRFARKNYFYPDLPKNYQISQYEQPLSSGGYIEIETDGGKKRIGITRIHLEEDAGKLVHGGALEDADSSFVDFNRCGVPLIEIVSEPDLRTPEEAKEYLAVLKAILEYLEVCDGNMEEGSLRCDANVSVRPRGSDRLGTKAEVKNMNSFRAIQRALEHEIARQIELLRKGEKVMQETRLWDAAEGVTVSMRSKEEAHDYRYFPEPDLVPLRIPASWVEEIKRAMPELPQERKTRFVQEFGIPAYDAGVLTSSKALAQYYEECVRLHPQPKLVSNWVMVELLGLLNKEGKGIEKSPISPQALGEMLDLIEKGVISGKIAKAIFEEMYQTAKAAPEIVQEKGLTQISDERELARLIEEVLAAHPGPVAEYKAGKEKSFTFLVGQVMKASRGKANPVLVNRLLQERLQAQ